MTFLQRLGVLSLFVGMLVWLAPMQPFATIYKPIPTASACSGEFITPNGYILSAAHCVKSKDSSVEVIYKHNGKATRSKAKIIAINTKNDLLLLKTEVNGQPYFTIGPIPKPGDTVIAVGWPDISKYGPTLKKNKGTVLHVNDYRTIANAPIYFGMSGGALLNQNGQLVGITSAGLFDDKHRNAEGYSIYGFFVGNMEIRVFLYKHGLLDLFPEIKSSMHAMVYIISEDKQ